MTTLDRGPVTVVSVPAGHPYVAAAVAAAGEVDDGLLVLPDVIPDDRPAGQWWPPLALDPRTLGRWLECGTDGGNRMDILHVHFGFEGVALEDLEACIRLLDDHDVPLVVTVHDLQNPHMLRDDGHAARLGRLVRAADALITLTPDAAAEVQRRWGRTATVIGHPHVAPLERIDAAAERAREESLRVALPSQSLRVALPLKSLRANTLTASQVGQVVRAVTQAGDDLEVGIHPEALQPDFIRHDPDLAALLGRLSSGGGLPGPGHVTVRVHERLGDAAFLDDLAHPDAVILPYRFGTHSGVLEACRDVHTVALVPTVGCYASQAPSITWDPDDIPGTLPAALDAVREGRVPAGWFVDRAGRERQARAIRRAHREVYAAALARRERHR